MATHGTDKMTITLNQSTIDILRRRKRGTPWDEYLLNGTNRKCGIECMGCGKWLEAGRTDISQDTLAKFYGWQSLKENGVDTVGFLCKECAK